MANIKSLIDSSASKESLHDLFMGLLHNDPYALRYSLDSRHRPNWVLVHPTPRSDVSNKSVQESNGIIFDQKTWAVIAQGMPLLIPSTQDSVAQMDGPFRIEESEDGTVLRVFWNEDVAQWTVSTNRRISATTVKWQSQKTFETLFMEAISNHYKEWKKLQDIFEETLSKDYVHSFILLHPENSLVVVHRDPFVVYVSARNRQTGKEESDLTSLRPEWAKFPNTLTREEAAEKYAANDKSSKRGLIYSDWSDPGHVLRYKVDYPWYEKAHDLRRNMPNMHLSYLAARNDDERDQFRNIFPDFIGIFDDIDARMDVLKQYAHRVYRNSYIRHRYRMPQNHVLYESMRRIHHQYRTTGTPIKQEDVDRVIERAPAVVLNDALMYLSYNGFLEPDQDPNFTQ